MKDWKKNHNNDMNMGQLWVDELNFRGGTDLIAHLGLVLESQVGQWVEPLSPPEKTKQKH